jgi:hypothetical protein
VTEADNELQTGDPFPMTSSAGSSSFTNFANADLYAVEEEKYLGSLCAVTDSLSHCTKSPETKSKRKYSWVTEEELCC